jgi:hypothetical protein
MITIKYRNGFWTAFSRLAQIAQKLQGEVMSEAHEKTRIRQLEDAAAHWEHKYTNARQYNRNLEERIRELEAALRGLYTAQVNDTHPIDFHAAMTAARAALAGSPLSDGG